MKPSVSLVLTCESPHMFMIIIKLDGTAEPTHTTKTVVPAAGKLTDTSIQAYSWKVSYDTGSLV